MLHLKKLCVGIKSFEMLQEWQDNELKCNRQLFHTTRMKPKKINEILPDGSIYWIAKNKFFARQKIIEFQDVIRRDGKSACKIIFDKKKPILTDYLGNSDRATAKVKIDPGGHLRKGVDKTELYDGVTDRDPSLTEARALMKDPDNANNAKFVGATVATGTVSPNVSSPTPPAIGRSVNPSQIKKRGSTPVGQSSIGGAKRYTAQ